MEIKLDDDKNSESEIEINKMNNNILITELMNKSDTEENNQHNKKNKIKIKKDKSASPKRKKTSKIKKHNKNNKDNDIVIKKLFTMDALDKNDKDNSHESDGIYKFIIDNANETEENFFKKLKKEIKRVETKKEIKTKRNTNVIMKSLTIRHSDIKKHNKNKSDINPFDFSQTAKYLMTKEDIEVSSIGKDDKSTKEKDKIPLKTWGTMKKMGNIKNNLLNNNEKNENNNITQNGSDKKSLICLLSELVEI